MSQLHEIAVRAKYDGAFTQEWATIKRLLAPERGHRKNGGGSELEKLRTWAEREGLCLDFEVEFVGFSSAIRTVTFWNRGGSVAASEPGQADAHATVPNAEMSEAEGVGETDQPHVDLECIHEDFDWDSVKCGAGGDDEAWAALSRDVDFAIIGNIGELAAPPEAQVAETPVRKPRRGGRARTTRKPRKTPPEVNEESEAAALTTAPTEQSPASSEAEEREVVGAAG